MSRLTLHRLESDPAPPADSPPVEAKPPARPTLPPLLVSIDDLATLLSRSANSLHRDDAAGRLPAALRIHGSKRWRYCDIVAWVELGCPCRADFEARRLKHR